LIKIANRTSLPELTWATIKSRLQALGCTGKWHKQVFNIYKSVYHLLLLFAIYFAERRETKEHIRRKRGELEETRREDTIQLKFKRS